MSSISTTIIIIMLAVIIIMLIFLIVKTTFIMAFVQTVMIQNDETVKEIQASKRISTLNNKEIFDVKKILKGNNNEREEKTEDSE